MVGLTVDKVLFAIFAVLCVASALGVVLLRDPIKGAMSLIGCFFTLASLFILQNAELMAALEVLVYAGAIMVLFVFVLMLVEDKNAALVSTAIGQKVMVPFKLGLVVLIAGVLLYTVARSPFGPPAELPEGFGNPTSVGLHFFSSHVFLFEMTSILLLGGIVGAVVITRRTRIREE